jgi:hypothetical protein
MCDHQGLNLVDSVPLDSPITGPQAHSHERLFLTIRVTGNESCYETRWEETRHSLKISYPKKFIKYAT